MKTYRFKLVLADTSDLSDEQGNALFAAGCDDGTLVSRDGVAFIRFSRDSSSLEDTINSAAANSQNVGYQVGHV